MSEIITFVLSFSTCLFPIFFIGLALAIGVISSSAMRRRMNEGWGSLAQRTGLTLSQANAGTLFASLSVPDLRGDYEGRPVKLWTYTVRHGKSSTRYTAMQMALKNPNNFSLSIRRQHGLDGIGKAFGMQDVQVGDAAFDNEFVIKSRPEGVAQALFGGGSQVREAVRRIPRGGVEINGAAMVYKQTGLETDTETLYNILNSLREIANAIEGTSGEEREVVVEPKADSVWADKSNFGDKDEFGSKDQYASDDPFYQKKAQPDLYGNPTSNDPFGPPPTTQTNWRPILIGAFIAFDLLCVAVLAVLYFSGTFDQFFQ